MTIPQEQSSTTRVFVYLRVSSKIQLDGDGFDRQLIACERYAQANGIEIAEVFREQITGKSELEDRPVLGQLFAALEENGVKTVLIERLDRLARDLMVQETILTDMRKHGYTLLSAAEPDLCSTDPSRVLMRHIFGAIAQYDKTMIVLKLKAARDRIKARTGKCGGRDAYGAKEGEAATLALMQSWRRDGMTYQVIAAELNARGIKTRAGESWIFQTVGKILSR